MQVRPVLQVRLASAPAPQQVWPAAPQAVHIAAAPTPVHWKPMLQVPAPTPAAGGQHT
jgi:hypothetical protein